MLPQRSPRPEIAPSEVRGIDKYLLGFFHNGIVYGNILAKRELLVYHILLLGHIIIREYVLEAMGNFRMIDPESVDYGTDIPYENAGIPQILVLLDVLFRHLARGLLGKGIDTKDVLLAGRGLGKVGFYIPITGFSMRRAYSQSNDGIRFGRKLHRIRNGFLKSLYVSDDVVAGSNDDVCLGIAFL